MQGDSHHFTTIEQPAKEWECVLLWDLVLQVCRPAWPRTAAMLTPCPL